MEKSKIDVETLDNGLSFTRVTKPGWNTSSCRLVIKSGSIHETEGNLGSAHFLEHITHQGSEGLPDQQAIMDFKDKTGTYENAFTSLSSTTYVANGYDLKSVLYSLQQRVFSPLLTPEASEQERLPIINEISSYESDPHYAINSRHREALLGQSYALPIGGYSDDLRELSHEALVEYYNRNYRIGNAVLIICSNEPLEKQRKIAEKIFGGLEDKGKNRPTTVTLDEFNPQKRQHSLELLDQPNVAQTRLDLSFGLSAENSSQSSFLDYVVANTLSRLAFNKLREEKALAYGAEAEIVEVDNIHFDQNQHRRYLSIDTEILGKDTIKALDVIEKEILTPKLSEKDIRVILGKIIRGYSNILEFDTSDFADLLQGIVSSNRGSSIDLAGPKKLAKNADIEKIQNKHLEIVKTQPLILEIGRAHV